MAGAWSGKPEAEIRQRNRIVWAVVAAVAKSQTDRSRFCTPTARRAHFAFMISRNTSKSQRKAGTWSGELETEIRQRNSIVWAVVAAVAKPETDRSRFCTPT